MAKKSAAKKKTLAKKVMKKTKGGQNTPLPTTTTPASQSIVSPRDPQSGLSAGQRTFGPVTYSGDMGIASTTALPPP